jgi:flagellar biosynthetic protein FliQ
MATFWLSAPLLAIGLVAGILVSLVQIITSIQDTAFSAVPRLLAFMLGIMLLLPWMLMKLMDYTTGIIGNLSRFAR